MEYTINGIEGKYNSWNDAREELISIQSTESQKLIRAMESLAANDPKARIGLEFIKECIDYSDLDYEGSPENHDAWFVNDLITEVDTDPIYWMVIDTGNGHTGAFELGEGVDANGMIDYVKATYPKSYSLMHDLGMIEFSDDPSLYGAVAISSDEAGIQFMKEVE